MPWIEDVPVPVRRPLIGGRFMHPDAVTMLFGKGGTGKGLIGAWTVRQLASEGYRTLVLDFEQHPDEWVPRLSGVPPQSVMYEAPDEDLAAVSHRVTEIVSDSQIGAVVIDSAFRALPEPLKGQTESAVVRKMYGIMHRLAIPTLVIAHVPKAAKDDEPKHVANPLGSIQWTNQARLTYSAIKLKDGDPTQVETKCMKVNDRAHPLPRTWEFYHSSGDVRVFNRGERSFTASRVIWELLQRTHKVMTPAEISVTLRADFPQHEDKLSRLQIERLLYRRRGELYRKVVGGWVSIDSERFFVFDTQVDEDA